jgi:TolA-binding protein
MRLRLCLISLSLVPYHAFGASKEIVELQRDVAQLQDQLRTMQSSTAEKLTALTVLVQQTLDASNRANSAVAVLGSRLNDSLDKQAVSVGKPIAVLGSKVDQMSNDFGSVRDAMADVQARLGKLEQKLVDLNNTVRTIQAPPPAPVSAGGPGPTAPPIPPDELYENATRDRMGGKADLALKEYTDYVQLYGDTDNASSAQYWIGRILTDKQDYPNAAKAFDAVLERYPQSPKTGEALLFKGKALVQMGQPTDGAKEFRMVISKFPRSDVSPMACTELKKLGFNCTVASAPGSKKKR